MNHPSQVETPRVGIFGGTFNPIHVGHLRVAEEIAEHFALAELRFVPCAEPPHKPPGADPLAPAAERLRWIELAIADNPRFRADPSELARGGISYSVETLRAVASELTPELPLFVIGSDAFRELDTWKAPEEVLALAHFAVLVRPSSPCTSLMDCMPTNLSTGFELEPDGRSARHRSTGNWLCLVNVTALAVSASDIRARLRARLSLRYLLPESVRAAVLASGCYGK